MAITIALVFTSHNWLRYRVTSTGGTENTDITSTGAATPDLITDSPAGAIKKIARAHIDGYGKIAAGATVDSTLAKALLESNDAESLVGPNLPVIQLTMCVREGAADTEFGAVAFGTGGSAAIKVWHKGTPGVAYLDVEIPGGIGA